MKRYTGYYRVWKKGATEPIIAYWMNGCGHWLLMGDAEEHNSDIFERIGKRIKL